MTTDKAAGMTFMGMRIVSHPLLDGWRVPVLKIRDEVPCDEPTRRKVNAYLRETFGEHEQMIIANGSIFMSPKHVVLLKNLRSEYLPDSQGGR